jgi:Lipocalin-like domain
MYSMIRRKAFKLLMLALPLAVALSARGAPAQETAQEQLVRTWTLILVDNVLPDGSRIPLYGPNPKGIVMFDAGGHYSLQIMRDSRPKFAANDKSKGTAEEYKAAVQGSNCHFGRYTVNEQDHTVTLYVEHATYSNWEGTELKWSFTIAVRKMIHCRAI